MAMPARISKVTAGASKPTTAMIISKGSSFLPKSSGVLPIISRPGTCHNGVKEHAYQAYTYATEDHLANGHIEEQYQAARASGYHACCLLLHTRSR